MQSVRGLKMGIMELYQKHVEGKFKLKKINRPTQEEFGHQRELLERKVKTLEHELKKERDKSFRTHLHLIKDNRHLLFQTRELREEVSRTQTPLSSAPGSRMGSRPATAPDNSSRGTIRELNLVRKQLAELQLELSAKDARMELLEEQMVSGEVGLKQCMGVKKKPLSRR